MNKVSKKGKALFRETNLHIILNKFTLLLLKLIHPPTNHLFFWLLSSSVYLFNRLKSAPRETSITATWTWQFEDSISKSRNPTPRSERSKDQLHFFQLSCCLKTEIMGAMVTSLEKLPQAFLRNAEPLKSTFGFINETAERSKMDLKLNSHVKHLRPEVKRGWELKLKAKFLFKQFSRLIIIASLFETWNWMPKKVFLW